MSWSQRRFEPERPASNGPQRMRFPCPGLLRFGGAIGFGGSAAGVWYLGLWLFGLSWDADRAQWDAKMVALMAAAMIAGAVGGLIGFGVGASIEVREERAQHAINVLWHYLANGAVLWLFLLMLVLQKTYGKDGMERFNQEIGRWLIGWTTAVFGGGGSLVIGAVLLLAGLLRQGEKPRLAPCLLLAALIATATAWLQWSVVPLERGYWLFVGVIHGAAIVPVCAWFIERDRQIRRQLLKDRP